MPFVRLTRNAVASFHRALCPASSLNGTEGQLRHESEAARHSDRPGPTEASPLTRYRWAAAALGAYLLVYLSWQLLGWIPGPRETVGDLLILPVDVAATLAAWCASRRCARSDRLRSFWRWIALALAAEMIGDLIQAIYDVGLHHSPYPSVADPFYLAFYPLLLFALLRIPAAALSSDKRTKTTLDVATIVVGGGAVVWYLVLGPTALEGHLGLLAMSVSLAFPSASARSTPPTPARRAAPALASPSPVGSWNSTVGACGSTARLIAPVICDPPDLQQDHQRHQRRCDDDRRRPHRATAQPVDRVAEVGNDRAHSPGGRAFQLRRPRVGPVVGVTLSLHDGVGAALQDANDAMRLHLMDAVWHLVGDHLPDAHRAERLRRHDHHVAG